MRPALQRRIQRYGWDRAAPHYEPGWRRQLRPAHRRLIEMADPGPGERVLDVACGSGLVACAAAERVGPDGSVIGVDLSEAMLEEARRVAGERDIGNVSFRRADAEALGLPEESFDVGFCAFGLMYAPDPVRALGEIRRVLAPGGGRAAIAVWGERSRCGWAEIFPIVDRRVASEVCPLFFRLGTDDTLARSMRSAGLSGVVSERLRVTLRYDSDESACRAAFRAGAVALAYRRFDDETRKTVRSEYLESITPYRTDGGYEIPAEFVLASGRNDHSDGPTGGTFGPDLEE